MFVIPLCWREVAFCRYFCCFLKKPGLDSVVVWVCWVDIFYSGLD